MGGSSIDVDREFTSLSNAVRTVVLVGRTGNGKSATGNSIIGRRAFTSKTSSAGVTRTCQLESNVLRDGQVLNVIDTPGLFDFKAGNELVKCIGLAKDGIHAVLIVFSVRSRFSQEEATALRSLQTLFGSKIIDYTIVVFTGGDDLEENDETLEDYLGRDCPEPLKEILGLCENRCVLFDNKTKDERKRFEQVQKLLNLVNKVITQNGGRPYTDEDLAEAKKRASLLEQQEKVNSVQRAYDEQLKRINEMLEGKLKEITNRLGQQVADEHAARRRLEESTHLAQVRANDEIRELREKLKRTEERANDEIRELREKMKRTESEEERRKREDGKCAIL